MHTRSILVAFLAATLSCTGLSAPAHGTTGRIVARSNTASAASAQVAVAATPKRHRAIRYAYAQKGDPYRYGGTGPGSWDCSGLVSVAYGKQGIRLPRTTYDMLKSAKLYRTSSPRWGDLVFTSSGHVEFYVHKKNGIRIMFGAHRSGTRVGYKKVYRGASGYPKYFRVRGAG